MDYQQAITDLRVAYSRARLAQPTALFCPAHRRVYEADHRAIL